MTEPRFTPWKIVLALTICASWLAGLAACHRGPRNFDNENDTLRRENLRLTDALQQVTGERDEAQAKLAEAQRVLNWDDQELRSAIRQAIPRCVRLEIGMLSGAVDTDLTPGFDAVDIYLIPRDGRGRFVQIVGTLDVRADYLPGGSGESRLIAHQTLDPQALREAYRSSLMGTHYAIRLTFDKPIQPPLSTVDSVTADESSGVGAVEGMEGGMSRELSGGIAISAEFSDALTGKRLTVRKVVDLPSAEASR